MSLGQLASTTIAEAIAPTRVAIVDTKEPLPVVSHARGENGPYKSMWILVLTDGHPVGVIEGPLEDDLTEDSFSDLIATHCVSPPVDVDGPWLAVLPEQLPFISVVVPTTFDRLEDLRACVELLSGLDYPKFEVLVVDNRPDRPGGERERMILEAIPRVRVLEERTRGASAARNLGIREACGSVVAFTDDDVKPHSNWLMAIGSRFVSEPEAACVSGLVVPSELESPAQVWFETSGFSLDRNLSPYSYRLSKESLEAAPMLAKARFLIERHSEGEVVSHWLYMLGSLGMGCNLAFRREVLEDLGGFDKWLGAGVPSKGGEDIQLLMRLLSNGHVLSYEPSAIISHTHRRTYGELREQVFGYGMGLTAALTSLCISDPRHIVGLSRVLVPAVRSILVPSTSKRTALRCDDYPKELRRLEILGMLMGPAAYVRYRFGSSPGQKRSRSRKSPTASLVETL